MTPGGRGPRKADGPPYSGSQERKGKAMSEKQHISVFRSVRRIGEEIAHENTFHTPHDFDTTETALDYIKSLTGTRPSGAGDKLTVTAFGTHDTFWVEVWAVK